jgi:hypothetical protein
MIYIDTKVKGQENSHFYLKMFANSRVDEITCKIEGDS